MMLRILSVLCVIFIASLGWAANEVTWKVLGIEGKKSANSKVVAVVEATIAEGWHLYSIVDQDGPLPTQFTAEGATLGEITESQTLKEYDKGFLKDINFFKETATFRVPLEFTGDPANSKLSVRFQVCKDGTCLRPTTIPLNLASAAEVETGVLVPKVAATSDSNSPAPKVATKGTGEQASIEKAKESGLLAYLQLAFLAGLTALLTPCVFPMIPITVSFFSKKKEEGSAVKQAFLYCGGIIGTFTILGIIASVVAGATGLSRLANNPWLNLVLAAVFIVLALSLFGVFEIGLPSKFVNKFDASGKSGWIAPVMMGLTFSLTSFTCTLPFVGAVLLSAAQGDYFYPTVGMLAFSTAFCLPFFGLALFPQALSKLPKSGAWMVTVKAYMGFIELIAAIKFLSTFDLSFQLGLLTREVNLALWFMLLAMAGIYLLGWIRLPKVDDGKIGGLRRSFAIGTLVLALWIANGLNGGNLGKLVGFLPPSPYPYKQGSPQAANATKPNWEKNFVHTYDEAKQLASETGKHIFVDFTGQYCTNCRVMEQNVFPTSEVQAAFGKVVAVSLYTDRETPSDNENAKLQQKLTNTATLPTYAIVKPDGTTLVSSRPYTESSKEFAEWIEKNIQ